MKKSAHPTSTEWELLKKIPHWVGVNKSKSSLLVPMGDDCSLWQANNKKIVICQDMLVEGTHFLYHQTNAKNLAHKALNVNLSDFAAFGNAHPHIAHLSLGLPKKHSPRRAGFNVEDFLHEFYTELGKLLKKYQIELAGGDLVQSRDLIIDLNLIGSVKGRPILRSQAQVGDWIFSTGQLGLAGLGLMALRSNKTHLYPAATLRQLRGHNSLDFMHFLIQSGIKIHAAIDASDGLYASLLLMLKPNLNFNIQVRIEEQHPEIRSLGKKQRLRFILNGGEDYVVIFTLANSELKKINKLNPGILKKMQKQGHFLQCLGRVTKGQGQVLFHNEMADHDLLRPFEHF